MEYMVEYSYRVNKRIVKVALCTVFATKSRAEDELSYELSKLEGKNGYSDIQGSVIELESKK